MSYQKPCTICGASSWGPLYHGPIRVGKFGSFSADDQTVWRCGGCGVGFLEGATLDYESDDYRKLVNGNSGPETYYNLHDGEQALKLGLVGTGGLRGKVVADFGTGAGAFLDLVRGFASTTIAIEPTKTFHAELQHNGHIVFSYGSQVGPEWLGKVDLAFSFAVVEHVEDPLALFREIRSVLAPGGRALVTTPNRADWLLDLLPEDYGSFFYRQVHRWYFDAASLSTLGELAGFQCVSLIHIHRFDASNVLLWLRDRRPSGLGKLRVPVSIDAVWARALEQSGKSDWVGVWLQA
jgi:SAM-dependent methyltransferase